MDLGAAAAELEGLAVEAREVQAALADGGGACAAQLAAFRAAVCERLASLQAQLDEAQAAFKCVQEDGRVWESTQYPHCDCRRVCRQSAFT